MTKKTIVGVNRIQEFNERWYEIMLSADEKVYLRNVTTILGIINKGYNYDEWLKNNGHNAEIIMDRAGTLGTEVHALAEDILKGNTVSYDCLTDIYPERQAVAFWERFLVWCSWWKEFSDKNEVKYSQESVECIVYDIDLGYAGTCDLLAKVGDTYQTFDWKTGNTVGNKEKLQGSAYMKAAEQMYDIEIAQHNVVWMPSKKPNKKGYRVIEVPNTAELFEQFLCTKKIFDLENSDRPKVLEYPKEIDLEYIKNNEIVVNIAEV